MKAIFITLLLYSCSVSANYQFYHFDKKDFPINKRSYQRYVLPQLKNILKEYYQILGKLDPLQKEVIKIKSQTLKMTKVWRDAKKSCREVSVQCTTGLRKIYHLSRSLDQNLSSYLKDRMIFPEENVNIDSTLKLHASMDKLFNLNYQNLHAMEEYLITFDTPLFPHNKIHHNLGKNLHMMSLTCELAMTGKLLPNIQKEFDFIWNHFFKVIEDHLTQKRGQDFLLSRLGELNMSWNSFSMKMTKGILEVPEEVSKLVKLMHNRWNSILKIILRR